MKRRKLLLACAAGLLLGASFPPLPFGAAAMAAFVPLFFLLDETASFGEGMRYGYLAMFLFNAVTLYWTGGFTHMRDGYLMAAGGLLLLAHPFFFLVPVAAWLFTRRQFGARAATAAFPFFWTAFEYLHAAGQLSFPWNALGNTQSYDLPFIQLASFTGVYGLSFIILAVNAALWFLAAGFTRGAVPRIALLAAALILWAGPRWYGASTIGEGLPPGPSIDVGIVQPDIDPFEKWEGHAARQLGVLERLTADSVASADLIVWPETAVPLYILHPANAVVFSGLRGLVDSLGTPLLTGIPDMMTYPPGAAPRSSKRAADGSRYDTFNASMLLLPHRDTLQRYAKILLVPFAERVPFSEELSFLNAMQWNFGLGGWAHGRDTTIFRLPARRSAPAAAFGNLICYESAYPAFAAAFVRRGAEFLTVMTNDSWWGNTSGAYQHRQAAVVRAVENRRWVVQCANGGVSAVVDPYGRVTAERGMYREAAFRAPIVPLTGETFYTAHGDWFAEGALMLALFVLIAAAGSRFYEARRRGSEEVS